MLQGWKNHSTCWIWVYKVLEMIMTFRHQNVCCHCAPCLLKQKHKTACISVASQFVERNVTESDHFLLNVMTIWLASGASE